MQGNPESPLFSTDRVGLARRGVPVVVVGLPRSGSSYLSHLLSRLDDWFVFDDLYYYRQVLANDVSGPLSPRQFDRLLDFLGWQVKARIRHDTHFVPLALDWPAVDAAQEAVRESFRGGSVEWWELLEEWMVRLALHHGKRRWGFKAPQNFMYMHELEEAFPGTLFVFIVRDPRRVMGSIKYVKGEDGDPGQYQPVVYARYWRMAAEAVRRYERESGRRVFTVRYEEMVADPEEMARQLAGFLGSHFAGPLPEMEANTSFAGRPRHGITPTEAWICERIAGGEMATLGYGGSPTGQLRWRDVPDLVRTSWRFGSYQAWRLWRNPGARHAAGGYLRRLLRSSALKESSR